MFKGIDIIPVKKFINVKNIIGKKEGDVIYQKGESTEYLYLLIEGKVKLKFTDEDGTNIYVNKDKNEFFGENELISKTSRKSSAVADTDCRMYAFNLDELKSLVKVKPAIMDNIYENKTFDISEDVFNSYTREIIGENTEVFDKSKTTEKLQIEEPEEAENDNSEIDETENQDDNLSFKKEDEIILNYDTDNIQIDENEKNVKETLTDEKEEKVEDNPKVEEIDSEHIASNGGEVEPGVFLKDESDEPAIEIEMPKKEEKSSSFTDIGFGDNRDEEPAKEIESDENTEEEREIETKSEDNLQKEQEIETEPGIIIDEEEPTDKNDTSEETENKKSPSFTDIGFNETSEEPPEETIEINEEQEEIEIEEESEISVSEKNDPDQNIKTVEKLSDEEKGNITANVSTFYERILNAVKQFHSSVSTDEVINSIAEATAELVKAETGALYLVDNEKEELSSKIAANGTVNEITIKLSDGLQGTAAIEKRVIYLEKPRENKDYNPVIEDLTGIKVKSAIYYPLIKKNNETAAILELVNSERGSFNEKDTEILDKIASHALRAIDNTKLAEILFQRKKVSAVGELAEFLEEDIKNPALMIKHYAELIKKKDIPADVKKLIGLQVDQSNAIRDFLSGTIAFTNSKPIAQMNPEKIKEVLNEILGLLAEYVESRNTMIYKKIESDAIVKLNKRYFYQACYQIVKNACDAMPNEGKIYVTTEKDGNFIKIKLRDIGIGVSENLKEKIFKPFFSKKDKAGLGLTIADKIITDHDGYIVVESEIGQGATFIISLPIVF